MIPANKTIPLVLSPSGEIPSLPPSVGVASPASPASPSPLPELDELILPLAPAPSPQSSAPTEEDEPDSYLQALIPKTAWGKLLGLTVLGVTGTLSTLGVIKLLKDTGISEGFWITRTLGIKTTWKLYQQLGAQKSYEIVQAYGLGLPKVLIKHLGVKQTWALASELGFEKSIKAMLE